jgi:hypothetical protein
VLLLADDSEEGTAYSSGACEVIPGFSRVQMSLLTDFSFGADISCSLCTNRIDGIIVSVLDSSGADFGIKPFSQEYVDI